MRAAIPDIIKKRETEGSVFLVTGATGFLGSHTVVELLKRGKRVVVLVRRDKKNTAIERVKAMLTWFGISKDKYKDKLTVYEGTLERRGLGLNEKEFSELASAFDEVVHCAAETSFSEKKRADLESANIGILQNLLDLLNSRKSKCGYFHHISTVYVAGKSTGIIPETITHRGSFHNPYEETKYLGEKFLSKNLPELGVHLSIYRPSIVYGNSETGRSTIFNAVYYPVKVALFLRDTYLKNIREEGGAKAEKMGVQEDKEGYLYLPIRIEELESGEINLIPIDHYIRSFVSIMENSTAPGIFHIVNSKPNSLKDITGFFCKTFKVRGFHSATNHNFLQNPPNALDIIFSKYLELYSPYIRDQRRFDDQRARSILNKTGVHCPLFDQKKFSTCMEYAVSVNWKKPW